MSETFETINGQGLCTYAQLRYGWRRVKHNGCGLLAAYNALGLLGRPMDFLEIRRYFHHIWRPRFLGSNTFELRRFFRKQGLAVLWIRDPSELEQRLKEGGVAVMIQWNSRIKSSKIPNPLKGAHLICATWEEDQLTVYNRYSNRSTVYRYSSVGALYEKPKLICALYLSGEAQK